MASQESFCDLPSRGAPRIPLSALHRSHQTICTALYQLNDGIAHISLRSEREATDSTITSLVAHSLAPRQRSAA
jgi:hypothetical protein